VHSIRLWPGGFGGAAPRSVVLCTVYICGCDFDICSSLFMRNVAVYVGHKYGSADRSVCMIGVEISDVILNVIVYWSHMSIFSAETDKCRPAITVFC